MQLSDAPLDTLLRDAFASFVEELTRSRWYGKEREAISLFAMSHLVPRCTPGSVLYDPRQIGIEVRVPQPPELGPKPAVCKDLVIWPKPAMTCFEADEKPTLAPLAILEWKWSKKHSSGPKNPFCAHDVQWLKRFTELYPTCTGYVVCYTPKCTTSIIRCARIRAGQMEVCLESKQLWSATH